MDGQNGTKNDARGSLAKALSFCIVPPAVDTGEQGRTVIKKKLFLEHLKATALGVITVACEKADIARETFYRWKKEDPEFVAALKEVEDARPQVAEDMLMQKMREGDGPSIRFFLERRTPGYKNRVTNEIVAGAVTAKQVIDEINAKRKAEYERINGPDQQGNNTRHDVYTGQEGPAAPVPVEHGPGVLLGETTPAQPGPESEAKRVE